MLPTWSNRSSSFVVKTRISRKITVFKNQSQYIGVQGEGVKAFILCDLPSKQKSICHKNVPCIESVLYKNT